MTYDPSHPDYFVPDALEPEMRRIYDICHGCRLCFNLCPSFPALFDAVDAHEEAGDGEVDALTNDELWDVVDLCYNCKLCYPKCPYTPPHQYNLDFPRLMLRAKAVDAKQNGIKIQDRVLGRPDIVGKLGSLTAPLSNVANALPITRTVIEKTVGIHRDFNLPEFATQSFESWFAKASKQRRPAAEPVAKVALFATCTGNYNDTAVTKAMTQVLWHNKIEVVVPEQVCCGMPLLDGGDVDGCIRSARHNARSFVRWVDEGYDVVIQSPTCSYVFKEDYPELLGTEEAARIAERTFDLCEYLVRLHGVGKLRTDFGRGPGKVGYHLPCHLKVQNIGYKSRDLLQLIPGTQVEVVEKCSVVDGTWGMKSQYFELSQHYAKKLYRGLETVEADAYASDCPLSRQQIAHGTGKKAQHPIELVRDAYGISP